MGDWAVRTMCEGAGMSRAGFYRFRVPEGETDRELELRDAIQRMALEMAC